ncbi:uncharacterized protein LOC120347386 [Styela clava]
MLNTTNTSTTKILGASFGTLYDGHTLWVGCQITLTMITSILLYICVCISRFAWLAYKATKRRIRSPQDLLNEENECGSSQKHKKSLRKRAKFTESCRSKYKRIMVLICLLAAIFSLIKCVADQLKFFYAWNARSDWICEFVYDITDFILFLCAFIAVYGFLWLKQWIFYRDPAVVGILYNRSLVIFSRVFVVFVVVAGFANMLANLIPARYKAGNSTAPGNDHLALANDKSYLGCVSTYDMDNRYDSWPLIWYAALAASIQITLLALFIYPLLKQRIDLWKWNKQRKNSIRTRQSVNTKSNNEVSNRNSKENKSSSVINEMEHKESTATEDVSAEHKDDNCISEIGRDQMTNVIEKPTMSEDAKRTITRAVTWTAICVATDFILFLIFANMGPGTPLILISTAQDIDLFLNIICLVATYGTWQQILFPLCVKDDVMADKPMTSLRKSNHRSTSTETGVEDRQ